MAVGAATEYKPPALETAYNVVPTIEIPVTMPPGGTPATVKAGETELLAAFNSAFSNIRLRPLTVTLIPDAWNVGLALTICEIRSAIASALSVTKNGTAVDPVVTPGVPVCVTTPMAVKLIKFVVETLR